MSDMKHTLLLCLAAIALAACTQDELTDNPSATSQTLEIASATIARAEGDEATTTDAGTGTVDGNWVKDDEITVMFMGNNATAIYKYSNGSFTSDNPINCNGQTAFAQAWTNYGVTPNPYDGSPAQWKVETVQSGVGYRQSDFLYAGTQSYVGAGTPANFTFYHQTAKIVVHVRNSGIVARKSGLGMTVGNDNIYIDGKLSTPTNGVYTWTPGDTQGTITPYNLGQQPMSDGNTSLVSFGALVIPQTISEGQTLFTFTVDEQTYYYKVPTEKSITWNAGTEYTYNVMIGPDATTRSAGTPGCEVRLVEVQDMNEGGKTVTVTLGQQYSVPLIKSTSYP